MSNLKQKILLEVAVIGFIMTAVCITACSDDEPIIKETNDPYKISAIYNQTGGCIEIRFENTDQQDVTIELIDKRGMKILDIYQGILYQGTNMFVVNPELLQNGIYFIRFIIQDKIAIRKVIVNKK